MTTVPNHDFTRSVFREPYKTAAGGDIDQRLTVPGIQDATRERATTAPNPCQCLEQEDHIGADCLMASKTRSRLAATLPRKR